MKEEIARYRELLGVDHFIMRCQWPGATAGACPELDPTWRNQAGRSINGTTERIAAGTVIKPIRARAVG